jgi:hypothetical protein
MRGMRPCSSFIHKPNRGFDVLTRKDTKMRRTILKGLRLGLTATGCALLAACASAPVSRQNLLGNYQSADLTPARRSGFAELRGPIEASKSLRLVMSLRGPGNSTIAEDKSVGTAGLLGLTTNEVVPIPGTDMIQFGFLQEGSFSQTNFRSGSQESVSRGGSNGGAVLIFKIIRP